VTASFFQHWSTSTPSRKRLHVSIAA